MAHLTRGALALVPLLLLSGGLEGRQFSLDQAEYVLIDPASPLTVATSSASSHVSAVLTNPTEVQRILRRSYHSLELGSSIGSGTVVLRLEVEEDGHVTLAKVVKTKPDGFPGLPRCPSVRRMGTTPFRGFRRPGCGLSRSRWIDDARSPILRQSRGFPARN